MPRPNRRRDAQAGRTRRRDDDNCHRQLIADDIDAVECALILVGNHIRENRS
jgi:hypothetical protein